MGRELFKNIFSLLNKMFWKFYPTINAIIGAIVAGFVASLTYRYLTRLQESLKHLKEIKDKVFTPILQNLNIIIDTISLVQIERTLDFEYLASVGTKTNYIEGLRDKCDLFKNTDSLLLEDVKNHHYQKVHEEIARLVSYLKENLPLLGEYQCELIGKIKSKLDLAEILLEAGELCQEKKQKLIEFLEIDKKTVIKVIYLILHNLPLDKISGIKRLETENYLGRIKAIAKNIKQAEEERIIKESEIRNKIEKETQRLIKEIEKIQISHKISKRCPYV